MGEIFNSLRYVICITCLVGLTGFFLGGLAVRSFYEQRSDEVAVSLEALPVPAEASSSRVYASSRGKRYYPWWCDAGSSIVDRNLVWYADAASAGRAGYTLAKACEK